MPSLPKLMHSNRLSVIACYGVHTYSNDIIVITYSYRPVHFFFFFFFFFFYFYFYSFINVMGGNLCVPTR